MKKFLIRKNKRKVRKSSPKADFDELTKIGIIVQKVNSVEMRINKIIVNFYSSPDKKQAFMNDFMFEGRLRLNDKLKIFRSILKRKNIPFDQRNFESWIRIRNMVAHGIPVHGSRAEISFNDNIYDISAEYRNFQRYHAKMISLLEQCEK